MPLNCLLLKAGEKRAKPAFLVFLQQPCGHLDRLLVPRSSSSTFPGFAAASSRMLRKEEILYVHTTAQMRKRCQDNSRDSYWLDSYTVSVDLDLEVILGTVDESSCDTDA